MFNRKSSFKAAIHLMVFLLTFLLIGLVMRYTLRTVDDWAWGGSLGRERLSSGFSGYNGRYLGNLLILLLMKQEWIRISGMTVLTFLLSWSIYRYVGKERIRYYLLTLILIFVMPTDMFRQTIAWASGMANYIPPFLLVLWYLILSKDLLEDRPAPDPWRGTVLSLLLGFSGSLFLENMTLAQLLLALCTSAFSFFRFRKIKKSCLGYLIGSFFGTLLMFSNSAYRKIADGEDSYRTMGLGLEKFVSIFRKNYASLYRYYLQETFWLNLAAIFLLLFMLMQMKKKKERRTISNVLSFLFFVYLIFYLFYSGFSTYSSLENHVLFNSKTGFLFAGLFFVVQVIIPIFYFENKIRRCMVLLPLGYSLIILLPMFFVTPFHSRVVVPSYLFRVLFVCALAAEVFPDTRKSSAISEVLTAVAAASLLFYYGFIYHEIYDFDQQRMEYVREQISENKNEVVLPAFPENLNWYLFQIDIVYRSSYWENNFKTYYQLSEEIHLVSDL